jgi:hypothetical protein
MDMIRLIPVIISVVAIAMSIGVYLYKVRQHDQQLAQLAKDLKSTGAAWSKKLYQEDGAPIYMSSERCRDCRVECQTQREKDVSGLKGDIKEIKQMLNSILQMLMSKP